MERLAIIDHATHQLFVEDVSIEEIESYGGEENYINENYTFEGMWTWDYIVDTEYFPLGDDKTPLEVNFEEL